ncbi:MAG: 2,3-bisphosphoglycerate-independent phosphoglycerate mutase [Dehalococcoidia bacterium]|nr:2,3-bisphosphoglycerate-independent phosphoglycerate mutase [Dehalococcoidia bacterium]
MDFPYLVGITRRTPSRILFLVVDGIGGMPHPATGKSELETARIPNLDRLAQHSATGLITPVAPGIAPGSGPGHLALFGYDPLKYLIGRGVLEALGSDVALAPGDVAARGNFCTLTPDGLVADRRAGRVHSETSGKLCHQLNRVSVPGARIEVHPGKEHRFTLVLRGEGLSEEVSDTDPSHDGVAPLAAKALTPAAQKTAALVNAFVGAAHRTLRGQEQANGVLLRGLSKVPALPPMGHAYKLHPAAIAAYPMYRGLAHVLGMTVLPTGPSFQDEVDTLQQHFTSHDFFYLHYKPADAAGEDGDFDEKVRALETLDGFIPALLDLKPDVLVVTGDHATPAVLAAHSWHPVPLLIHAASTQGDGVPRFTERAFANGSLGRLPSVGTMLLVLAHAGKLSKFGP